MRRRAEKLHADECHIGISDKLKVLDFICEKYGLSYQEIAYIGDDCNDLSVLQKVGLPCSVADATADAKKAATFITKAKGGEGAVREVADLIINCNLQKEKNE